MAQTLARFGAHDHDRGSDPEEGQSAEESFCELCDEYRPETSFHCPNCDTCILE